MKEPANIGFIGGGNMASAICQGIISKELYPPGQIWVSGPHINNLNHMKSLGCNVTTNNGLVLRQCNAIFICVKPHFLEKAIDDCVDSLRGDGFDPSSVRDKLFISILAGTSLFRLEQVLSHFQPCRIVRVMPNTPMLLGEGVSVYAPGDSVSPQDCELVEKILDSCGIYERVCESMINAVGGLAGSGPAFVYLMIEAMADGGVKQGIPRPMAMRFAAQTALGAAKMVLNTGKHPGQLKDEVCSAGGSTICGVHALESGGIRGAYIDAVEAAVRKTMDMDREH